MTKDHVIMPSEPTYEILCAIRRAIDSGFQDEGIYRAIVATILNQAPQEQQEQAWSDRDSRIYNEGYNDALETLPRKTDTAPVAQQAGQPAPAVLEGWRVIPPITEEMHVAAVKVLQRASGLDGLPQRMVDAMINASPAQEGEKK